MRGSALIPVLVIALVGCRSGQDGARAAVPDERLVVFGPSLVEMMFASGLGERVVGVDRYSEWPEEAAVLPRVGGYLDPNLEAVAALEPTSIHSVGFNADLAELSSAMGISYYHYSFDDMGNVYKTLNTLDSLYECSAGSLAQGLEADLDSLRGLGTGSSALLVVHHNPGSGSITAAGRGTFLADLLEDCGGTLSAPDVGSYPRISVEGVLELDPEVMIYLCPDIEDTTWYSEEILRFWRSFGRADSSVEFLFEDYVLIPGARLPLLAEELSNCIR